MHEDKGGGMGCDAMQDGFSVNGWPPRPRKVLAAFRCMQRETMLFELHPNGGDAATITGMIAPMIGGTRHGTAKHGTARHGTGATKLLHGFGITGEEDDGAEGHTVVSNQTNKQTNRRNGTERNASCGTK
mmetsp:Transcript_21583/g.51149  ORF Transcript_21583/g.51149 Transcript_21583/m.51149 type:complete len:130 (-) Transcript_21583:352-741(-)